MPTNPHVLDRLKGIQQMLIGAHLAGMSMSSATKGRERETFVDTFLSEVLTPQYRFGTGDAIDKTGKRSGQLDVVIEYPLMPSLPIVGSNRPRLYLAEGIAAIIEVKSNILNQWGEVINTSSQLSPLQRSYSSGVMMGERPRNRIPLFAVGYTGWKNLEPVRERLNNTSIDGILVIDSGVFVSNEDFYGIDCPGSPMALWALIVCLHKATSVITSTGGGVPIKYLL